MQAGRLNEVIEIYKPEVERNQYGGQETNYTLYKKTRSAIRQISGRRTEENNEIVYDYDRQFVVRYYIDIEDLDVIKWNNNRYRVLSIDPLKSTQEKVIYTQLINE